MTEAEKLDSLRKARRRSALAVLVTEAGGVSSLAVRTGTPKSHFSAIKAGRRGVGDDLAAKLERIMERAPGWMDRDLSRPVLTLSPRAARLAELWDSMREGVEKEKAYAVTLLLAGGGALDEQPKPQPLFEPTQAQGQAK